MILKLDEGLNKDLALAEQFLFTDGVDILEACIQADPSLIDPCTEYLKEELVLICEYVKVCEDKKQWTLESVIDEKEKYANRQMFLAYKEMKRLLGCLKIKEESSN